MTENSRRPVLVVDFGAQYAQLIARRVREAGVYSEIIPHSLPLEKILAKNPAAIVLSGGPASVYADQAPSIDADIFSTGIPVFGICYGFQTMAMALDGTVERTGEAEYGRTPVIREGESLLLADTPEAQNVWRNRASLCLHKIL